jgi:hypothetical protein
MVVNSIFFSLILKWALTENLRFVKYRRREEVLESYKLANLTLKKSFKKRCRRKNSLVIGNPCISSKFNLQQMHSNHIQTTTIIKKPTFLTTAVPSSGVMKQ